MLVDVDQRYRFSLIDMDAEEALALMKMIEDSRREHRLIFRIVYKNLRADELIKCLERRYYRNEGSWEEEIAVRREWKECYQKALEESRREKEELEASRRGTATNGTQEEEKETPEGEKETPEGEKETPEGDRTGAEAEPRPTEKPGGEEREAGE